jgi:hypothetical protein
MADCYDKILGLDDETKKRLFGDREIPKDVLRRFVDDIQSIKDNFYKDPSLGTFESRLTEYVKQVKEFNKVTKEVRKLDLIKAKELHAFAKQPAFKGNVAKAIKAKLTFSTDLANNARDSANYRGLAIQQKLLTGFLASLEKNPEDFRVFKSGQLDKEIGTEVRALGENRGMGQTGNEQAQRIAKVMFDTNRSLMREHLNSGVPLADMVGYVAPLTHDVATVRSAGEDKWVADVKQLPLDKKAVFGEKAGDAAAEDKILRSLYKGVSLGKSGVSTALTVDSFDEAIYGQNLTRRLTESRSLRFASYEGEFQYNQMYGKDNLLNTFVSNINRKSTMLGLVQTFGSNPERQILATLSRLEGQYRSAGDFSAADQIKRESQGVMHQLHEIMGRSSIPGDNALAKISEGARSINILSKLFNVGARKIIDFPTAAMALKSYEGGNFLYHLGRTVGEFAKVTASKETLKDMGMFFSDFATSMNDGDRGLMPKATEMMMKVNGIGMLTTNIKKSFANLMMSDIASHAEKDFRALPERLQASMLSIGVNDKDWAIMRNGVQEAANGRKLLTHEGIAAIPHDLVVDRVAELNKETKGLKLTPEKYLNDMQNKYFGFIIQGSNVSGNVAGPKERAIFTRGTYKGETWGEILRLWGQFKPFWARTFNSALMAMNSNPDAELMAKGILQSGRKDFVTPAQWIVGSMAFSYIGQSLIDAAKGKGPEDPTHAKTWLKALSHAGAGGVVTELAAPNPTIGSAEQLLGPTFGQIAGPLAKMVGQGEKDLIEGPGPRGGGSFKKDMVTMGSRLIRNNIPFQQAPGFNQLLNAVQDNIQESLTPGYKIKKSIKTQLDEKRNRVNINPFGG